MGKFGRSQTKSRLSVISWRQRSPGPAGWTAMGADPASAARAAGHAADQSGSRRDGRRFQAAGGGPGHHALPALDLLWCTDRWLTIGCCQALLRPSCSGGGIGCALLRNVGPLPTPRRPGPPPCRPSLFPTLASPQPTSPVVGASTSSRPLPAHRADLTFPKQ